MIKLIRVKEVSFAIVLALLAPMVSLAQEPLLMDLNRAFNLAFEHNETYQIASGESDRADARIREAISSALPQLTGGLTYLRNWEIPTGVFQMGDETVTFKFGTNNSFVADLTVTQPIYSGGRTFTALSIAKVAKRAAGQTLRQAGQELRFQVYNGFYGALLAQEVYRVNQEAYKLAQDNLDMVQKMYNQGVSSEFDFLRARVAVANLEPAVLRAENDANIALDAFKNLVGIDVATPVALQAEFDSAKFVMPPIDPETAKTELMENRPEVLLSELNTTIRKKLISIAKAGYKPTLNFSTSLQYQRQYDTGEIFGKSWDRSITSAVVLQVPIFDSWRTPSQVKQARIDYQQARLQDQAVEKGMILNFEQSLNSYLEARTRLSAQGDAVELARRGLEIATVRFESGVGIQLEVSDARLALSQAEINRAVAFHDLAVSYAALLRSLGRDINP